MGGVAGIEHRRNPAILERGQSKAKLRPRIRFLFAAAGIQLRGYSGGRESPAGASVILADPIFKGLAIALMAGEIASLLISRMAVPVLYFMAKQSPAAQPGAPLEDRTKTGRGAGRLSDGGKIRHPTAPAAE